MKDNSDTGHAVQSEVLISIFFAIIPASEPRAHELCAAHGSHGPVLVQFNGSDSCSEHVHRLDHVATEAAKTACDACTALNNTS